MLTKIKKAIAKAQSKGLVYYPCNDAELLEEWGEEAETMSEKDFQDYVENNSICGGDW